jgi:4-amino-4-deoxy-L-arabinose transferase-like glycosyltransferase
MKKTLHIITEKLTVYYSLIYFISLCFIAFFFQISLDWFFISHNNLNDFRIIFPNYHYIAFVMLKCFPFLGMGLVVLFNTTMAIKHKASFLKIYDFYLFSENILLKYIFIGIVSIYILLMNATPITLIYNSVLILLIIFTILQLILKKSGKSTKLRLTTLIVTAITLRIIYFSQTGVYDMQEDSLARISQIYEWDRHGGFLGGLTWLPGHHILIFLIAKFFFTSYEIAASLLSFICSISIIPVIYFLFSRLFGKGTAYLTLLFYAISPIFIKFSTIQMVEIPFLFFTISGLSAAYSYFNTKEKKHLIISVICLNISSLMRFEAWIIIPLFAIIYFVEYRHYKKIILWGAASLFSAIMFSSISYYYTGDPIFGVTASDVEVKAELANTSYGAFINELIYWTPIPLVFFPFIFIGLVYATIKNKKRYLAIGIIALSSYYIFKMAEQSLMPFWRYLFFVILFALPFMFYFLQRFIRFKWLLLIFLLYYSVKASEAFKMVINSYQPPPEGFFESASFYKEKYGNNKDAKIILSMNPYSQLNIWIIYSGLYWERPIFHRLFAGAKTFVDQEDFTVANTSRKIMEEEYHYIVIQKGYEMDSILNEVEVADYLRDKKVETNVFGEMTIIKIN